MPQGFGENAVDRSLMHSVRRMNALTKVLGKYENDPKGRKKMLKKMKKYYHGWHCLLYTSPSPRDGLLSRMPSSA